MAQKCLLSLNLLILLISCVVLISGQDDDNECLPNIVRNLHLSGNSTLSWDPPLNESCDILHYLVFVTVLGTEEEWIYEVTDTTLDVGHLTPCLRYYFQVSQVTSENITGSFASMNIVTPPPSEAELALDYLSVTPNGRNVVLRWSLIEEWVACANRYRLVIVNEHTQQTTDIYTTSPSATVIGLTGCATYTFSVRAIFTLEEEGPITLVRHTATAANTTVPTINGITLTPTGVVLTLGLQSVERNYCPIYSIYVNAPPYFSTAFPVQDQNNRHTFKATLGGLQPDTLYYLEVSANNTAGITRPTLLAVQTLESD